jgi:hypothetical protein
MKNLFLNSAVLAALLCAQASAYFGVGGCPDIKANFTRPYGASGLVANGIYYSHYFDSGFYTILEGRNSAPTPTGLAFMDCLHTNITKTQFGVLFTRKMPYYGYSVDVMSYNMTCQGIKCADMVNPYIFETVYYNDTILIN